MTPISIVVFCVASLGCGWLVQLFVYQDSSHRSAESQVPASALERAFVGLLGIILIISWTGLVLAEIGLFSLHTVAASMGTLALVLLVWARRKRLLSFVPARFHLDRCDLLAIGVALLAAILYGSPGEWILGGEDPGTYVVTGIRLAETGSIVIHDDALSEVDPELGRGVLYSPSDRPGREGIRFPGFYVRDADRGTVIPQFFHVLPVWVATFYQVGGIRAGLLATPMFGVLALVALYLLGKRLISPGAGLFAAALLAVNISQLWFSTNAFADILVQFLVLSGLWALTGLADVSTEDRWAAGPMALLSGACFGVCHLTKLDAFIVPIVVYGFAVYVWFDRAVTRSHVLFVGVYSLLVAHSALHGYLFSWPYVSDIFSMFQKYLRLGAMGVMLFGALIAIVALRRDLVANLVRDAARYRKIIKLGFMLMVLILGIYAYFVRPLRADLGAMEVDDFSDQGRVMKWLRPLATDPQMRRGVRTYIEEGIVRTGWYLTPMGLWLGIAGFLFWATTRLSVKSAPFLLGSFLSACVLFYRGTLVPHFFWAFKRYVPLVVPAFMLFIAFLLSEIQSADRADWQSVIVPCVIGIFLLLSYARGSMQFWRYIEWEEAIEDVDAFAESFPEDSVLLFRYSPAGLRLGLPLGYVHDLDLFLVDSGHQNNARLRELIAGWHERRRPVYWLESGGDPSITSYGPIDLVDELKISWPVVPHRKDELPDRISHFSPHIRVYRVAGTEYTFPENVDAEFGGRVALLGYELDTKKVAPGGDLSLTLIWQGLAPMNTNYTVFTHLLDDRLKLVGQKDSQPSGGERPTSTWARGEIVRDSITIPVSLNADPGRYRLQVGLYNLANMRRLPMLDDDGSVADDKVILESVQVVPASALDTREP